MLITKDLQAESSPESLHFVSRKLAPRLPKACTSSPESLHFVSRKLALRLPKACTSSPESLHFVSRKLAPRLPKACTYFFRGVSRNLAPTSFEPSPETLHF